MQDGGPDTVQQTPPSHSPPRLDQCTPQVARKRPRDSATHSNTTSPPRRRVHKHMRPSNKFTTQEQAYKEMLEMKREEHEIVMKTRHVELEAATKSLEAANKCLHILDLWGKAAVKVTEAAERK